MNTAAQQSISADNLAKQSSAHGAVLERLRGMLPAASVITDAAGLRPYETDGLTAIREMPWVVVLPETEAQVAEIVRCCAEHGVPIIPRGAGTGLSGGARPHQQGRQAPGCSGAAGRGAAGRARRAARQNLDV